MSPSSGTSSGSSSPVERVPSPGEIVHVVDGGRSREGAAASRRCSSRCLAGDCLFLDALGDDDVGHRAGASCRRWASGSRWRGAAGRSGGVRLHRTRTPNADHGDGRRVGPRGDDPLPWSELDASDGVYFTAGDAPAVRAARAARTLVSTARAIEPLAQAVFSSTCSSRAAVMPGSGTRPVTSTRRRASLPVPPAPGRMGRGARRHDHRMERRAASRPPGRHLRRRRLLRGRSHLWARGRVAPTEAASRTVPRVGRRA